MTSIITALLPWIGTALSGPLGSIAAETVGKVLGMKETSVEVVKETLEKIPEAELPKLKEAEMITKVKLNRLGYSNIEELRELVKVNKVQADVAIAVNDTMKIEAAAEHWPTYSWRPYNGFLFGTTIFCCYFLLPILNLPVPEIPELVWVIWGSILGIASFFRGKAQADPRIPPPIQLPIKKD